MEPAGVEREPAAPRPVARALRPGAGGGSLIPASTSTAAVSGGDGVEGAAEETDDAAATAAEDGAAAFAVAALATTGAPVEGLVACAEATPPRRHVTKPRVVRTMAITRITST